MERCGRLATRPEGDQTCETWVRMTTASTSTGRSEEGEEGSEHPTCLPAYLPTVQYLPTYRPAYRTWAGHVAVPSCRTARSVGRAYPVQETYHALPT